MDTHSPHGGRGRLLAALAAVLAVAGVLTVVLGLRGGGSDGPVQPPRTVAAPADLSTAAGAIDPERAAAEPGVRDAGPASVDPAEDVAPVPDLGPILPASEPVALDIPSIGVHSDVLVPLTVGADGVLPAPEDYALPGWHTRGPRPGQLGPAVIAGHVDGPDGPAVFFRLGQLVAGDVVEVARQDGTTARFVVDSVERFAKAQFPTARVYGNTTDRAEIRLITCGGAFDQATGHYVDNIVAFGHLV